MSNPQNSKGSSNNSTSQSSSANNSTSQTSSSATNNTNNIKPPSKYRLVKDGWGSRSNFQHSYGLGLTPEGFEEGNRILAAFQEAAVEDAMEEQAAKQEQEANHK